MEPAEIAHHIRENGYCIVEKVIPSGKVDGIRKRVVRAQAATEAAHQARERATRARGHRVGARGVGVLKQAINHDQSFAPYLADRRIVGALEIFFGPWVRISCTDAVVNQPGNERGYWHADWPFNQTNASNVPAPYPDAMMHASSLWMLTDFSPANGGTLLLPGTHRKDRNPAAGDLPGFNNEAPQPDEINAQGRAGSVLLYDSRQWHAVAPNRSGSPPTPLVVEPESNARGHAGARDDGGGDRR
ncbi:MAG: phytanoyl-CoA dioxygenase family protein [Candidatus Latescibacteria bacterium]|nr:phytanoyl-CoA dioxygenase family protein [Candidatus Latescibacterota bacterium]